MTLSKNDFGSLCIYALRYCNGRQTYAPGAVISIVTSNLKEITDRDLGVMISDCEYQRYMDRYGDSKIDKPMWVAFESRLKKEREDRKQCQS